MDPVDCTDAAPDREGGRCCCFGVIVIILFDMLTFDISVGDTGLLLVVTGVVVRSPAFGPPP